MMVIGIDEVGRGCWAGPLLLVAAQLQTKLPAGLTDSKLLSEKQRLALFPLIETACRLGEGWVEPEEIDALGLTAAMRLGVARALAALTAPPNAEIIMDGHINYCDERFINVQAIIGADKTHPIVSAASIYAKVKRDAYMRQLAAEYPDYGFDKHVGYGTAAHRSALQKYGVTLLHRKSYKPVAAILA